MSTSFIKTQDFVLNYLKSFEKFDAATKEKWQDVFTAIFNCENSEEALTLITQAGGNVLRPQNQNNLSYTALKKGAFVFWEGDSGQSLIGLVTKQPMNETDKARVVVFTPNTMFSVSMTANELRNLQGIVDVNVPANVGVKGVVKMQELGKVEFAAVDIDAKTIAKVLERILTPNNVQNALLFVTLMKLLQKKDFIDAATKEYQKLTSRRLLDDINNRLNGNALGFAQELLNLLPAAISVPISVAPVDLALDLSQSLNIGLGGAAINQGAVIDEYRVIGVLFKCRQLTDENWIVVVTNCQNIYGINNLQTTITASMPDNTNRKLCIFLSVRHSFPVNKEYSSTIPINGNTTAKIIGGKIKAATSVSISKAGMNLNPEDVTNMVMLQFESNSYTIDGNVKGMAKDYTWLQFVWREVRYTQNGVNALWNSVNPPWGIPIPLPYALTTDPNNPVYKVDGSPFYENALQPNPIFRNNTEITIFDKPNVVEPYIQAANIFDQGVGVTEIISTAHFHAYLIRDFYAVAHVEWRVRSIFNSPAEITDINKRQYEILGIDEIDYTNGVGIPIPMLQAFQANYPNYIQ